jgi:hypothetical protein
MVETISPAVRGGRRGRYASTVALHVLGAGAAAAALGAALGGLGGALGAPWSFGEVLILAAAVGYALHEVGVLRVRIPAARRQVPEWWRTFYSPPTAALLYGVGLGVGFATFLAHGTLVVVCVGAITLGDPGWGAAVVAPFGLVRAAAAALGGARRPTAVVDRLDELAGTPLARAANGAVLVTLAGAAALA